MGQENFKPNRYGKYDKESIINNGYKILNYGLTYTDVKNQFGIVLTEVERKELIIGFKTVKGNYGYSPVYDIEQIYRHRGIIP